jgi:predicted  nucleic acid-binding Zn-ribbon protein
MPHVCIRCKTRLVAAEGLAPRCPECGGTKFSFESDRKEKRNRGEQEACVPIPDDSQRIVHKSGTVIRTPEDHTIISESDTDELIESIRILEPGKYNLNLLKLSESDDRVIRIGKDGNFRLDLHSMVRSKKKR